MSQRTVRRVVLVVVLALSFSLPGSAAPRNWAQGGAAGAVAFRLWTWLVSAWAKAGCISDPNGHCVKGSGGGATVEAGCISDPDGHCLSGAGGGATTEAGCGSDPSGLCR